MSSTGTIPNRTPVRTLILGAGESGIGAARLAAALGHIVLVSDRSQIASESMAMLESIGVQSEPGGHTVAAGWHPDQVVKSPGIPNTAQIIQDFRAAGVPILSEIEFASRHTQVPIIAVTGTNGKTTTTSLIHAILTHAGLRAGLGGNIGTSFAGLVAAEAQLAPEWYVLEISSFQLDDCYEFHPRIAVITNITENHLDRYHGDFQAYAQAKLRIAQRQTADDTLIYCLDSPALTEALSAHSPKSKWLGFTLAPEKRSQAAAWIDSETNLHLQTMAIARKNPTTPPVTYPLDKQRLRGQHNQYNSMAAALVGRVLDIRSAHVRESLESFESLEHRLERVRTVGGIDFINDSKATSVNATWYALESMRQPTIWFVGGQDKGNDYGMLLDLVKAKVKEIVMVGPDVRKIDAAFEALGVPRHHAADMEAAVRHAVSVGTPGDAVLLSPACASFDLFANYEARGRCFKGLVEALHEPTL
jgi:UDP-N-acetylmuramoylalanine--D-glutamate ligase